MYENYCLPSDQAAQLKQGLVSAQCTVYPSEEACLLDEACSWVETSCTAA